MQSADQVRGGSLPARRLRDLLAARAALEPDAPAILAPGRAPLTYASLLAQVDGASRALGAAGLGPADRVAVVLPNGPEMAVAFLAVATAAACAPLNPAYRAAEFEFYLGDLAACALVTLAGLDSPARAVARERGIPVVELHPDAAGGAGAFALRAPGLEPAGVAGRSPLRPSERRGEDDGRPDDVALVLHTSGTTSRPKMVPLTHANLCASAAQVGASLGLTTADRCLNVMPLFHVHGLVAAVLASLAAGGSVVCAPGFSAPEFAAWLAEGGVTWYTAVPTIHQAILARAARDGGASLRHRLRFVRSCSSPLPPSVFAELERVFAVPVVEAYGMTEAAHQICSNPLPPLARKPGSVGIAAGPEVAVMDDAGELLPAGETGEVVVRGASVTSGYLGDAAANAAAFARGWLRTGDLGTLDSAGYLYLRGRRKELINRGGEKVSPREVDEALLTHPAVAAALAFAYPDERLGEEIGAAVVLRPGADLDAATLRAFAAERLADFKVPRRIVFLDDLPKGPTGKPQRIGLAERLGIAGGAPADGDAGAEPASPGSPLEAQIAEIWAEVLGLARVGVADDYIELGGDSIQMTQIIARLGAAVGVELSPGDFFAAPTVADLARLVAERQAAGADQAISPRPRTGPLPCSFTQERLWFLNHLEPGAPTYNEPRAIRLRGALDVPALRRALAAVVARHEVLRTTIRQADGRLVQVVGPAGDVALPVVDLRAQTDGPGAAALASLLVEEARRPFDLSRDGPLRAALYRLAADDHVLLLVIHHIVQDGWSIGVLHRELGALYSVDAPPEPLGGRRQG